MSASASCSPHVSEMARSRAKQPLRSLSTSRPLMSLSEARSFSTSFVPSLPPSLQGSQASPHGSKASGSKAISLLFEGGNRSSPVTFGPGCHLMRTGRVDVIVLEAVVKALLEAAVMLEVAVTLKVAVTLEVAGVLIVLKMDAAVVAGTDLTGVAPFLWGCPRPPPILMSRSSL
jgi:hypothetical protein